MNCRRAQSDIALWAGDDLDEAGLRDLRIHLEACPECRKYLEQMQALLQLVDNCPLRDEADEASLAAVEDSLWPSLSTQLVSLPAPRHDRFNGWIPAVAVAAVCFAMVLVASPPPSPSPETTVPLSVTGDTGDNRPWSQPAEERQVPTFPPERIHRAPIEGLPVDDRPGQRVPTLPGPGSFFGPDDSRDLPKEFQENIRRFFQSDINDSFPAFPRRDRRSHIYLIND